MRWLPLVLLVVSCGLPASQPAETVGVDRQSLDAVTGFGANPGNLLMYRFVPAGLARGRPLVVLLHGCGDTAANFSTASGLEALATARQFALLVPQQQLTNNVQTCFNWFDSTNQARDQGELASINNAVDKLITDVGSDPQQLYVVGFSAGGAEAANVLAAYPDRYKAGVIAAGIPYKCTETLFGASACMSGSFTLPDGGARSPADEAAVVRRAFPGFTGPWPRVGIWHGLSDSFVSPTNRTELMLQWTAVHGIDQTADGTTPITSGGTRSFFRDASQRALVELNEVPNVGHVWRTAWAADIVDFFGLTAPSPDAGVTGGGAAGGGAAAGGAAGGGVASAGGTASAGGSASAGGAAAGGGTASAGGAATAGGDATGGGTSAAGGSSAGGSATAGGTTGGMTTPATGCQSCSSTGGLSLLGLLLFAFARRR